MAGTMWFMSVVALLVVDVRTGALQQKEGAGSRCYFCPRNGTCDEIGAASTVQCTGDQSQCTTVAVAPNFTSSLNCGVPAKSPCSLTYNSDKVLELVCTCSEDLCNAPYSKQLQKQLLTFMSSNFTKNNTSDYTDDFFKMSNITGILNIYKTIDIQSTNTSVNSSQRTTIGSSTIKTVQTTLHPELNLPRAEALKQMTTEPSDDEEDVEGSGAYEDSRFHRQPPPSAPADPSSYLPAKGQAPQLFPYFFVSTSTFLCMIA